MCFTPDEEVGKGADHFDPEKFPARVAYTVDGGELGEIEYENFNAAAVTLTVEGVNIHPGSAKNKMKNAILLANQFISLLPAAEAPAHTEGYEGFYHVTDLAGNESQVVLHAIIRDHDLEKFNARKAFVQQLADYLNAQWGQGTFRLEHAGQLLQHEGEDPAPYGADRKRQGRHGGRGRGAGDRSHPGRHRRGAPVLGAGYPLPQPVHRRRQLTTACTSSSPCRLWKRWYRCWWSW